jgi:DNA helicase-2/ATP-dependent DNA helicase PcrA
MTLLRQFPEVLHKYQHKFKYIMIDEYQDTNPAQYEIIKLLGAPCTRMCAWWAMMHKAFTPSAVLP